jgi:hypothetical protein
MKYILFSEFSSILETEAGVKRIYTEVSVDTVLLHRMARRAARSKGRKSVDGPLTIEVLNTPVLKKEKQ